MKPELNPLPSSGDEYWEYSSTELQEKVEDKACEHFFIHKDAQSVECKDCRIGFVLSVGWKVVESKIYTPDGFVV